MENELVQLGKIINTCGLKGEVKIYSTTYFAKERYKKNNEVLLEFFDENNDFEYKKYTIKSYRFYKGFDYVTFNEVNNKEDADKLINKNILIKKINAKISKDMFFFSDLINCKIIDSENKNELGLVVDVKEFNPNISLKIKVENKKNFFYIPFIDQFIKKVDIENKIIEINYIKGLLE